MNLLYPKLRLSWLPAMLRLAVLGAVLAGAYGIAHDQITYTISPEYFTRLKFAQSHYADFGLPPRVLVAEIGFLATWWAGFAGGWFLSRLTVPAFPAGEAFRLTLRGFGILFAAALIGSMAGVLYGLFRDAGADYSGWEELTANLGVQDLRGFVRVAYIHNASYLGALVGLVAAILLIRGVERANACTK